MLPHNVVETVGNVWPATYYFQNAYVAGESRLSLSHQSRGPPLKTTSGTEVKTR
jgi:hypothetical protein